MIMITYYAPCHGVLLTSSSDKGVFRHISTAPNLFVNEILISYCHSDLLQLCHLTFPKDVLIVYIFIVQHSERRDVKMHSFRYI